MGIDCKLDLLVIHAFFIYIYTYVYVFIHLPSISIGISTSYICICLAGQLAREINAKIHMTIDAKSVPGAAQNCAGAPKTDSKSIPGPSQDALWRPRAFGKHPKSVLEASRSSPVHPGTAWRVPESGTGCQEECQRAPGNASGPSKSMLSRARGHKKRVFRHGSFAKRCHREFPSIFLQFSGFS